ncbi:site-2 protease family protein [Neobacillus sp. LXY-4]|uniref:site-2 protease family protein n=1 Tax=Neobacillus sp. LXY-4 TaxID=3379826 RepID=UPI003EDF4621
MKKKKTWWASIGIGSILLFSKLKWILVFLKFFKFTTVITLLVSFIAYGLTYGWKFGIALIYILMLHEMGHVWAMKRLEIPTYATLFIPFIGALARGKEQAKNAYDDAYISYMGPAFGLLSIIPAILLYALTENDFWMMVIFFVAVTNLFNLIPIPPFDGGHIVKAINFKIVMIGFAFALVTMYLIKSYSLIFFILLGMIYAIVFYVERRNAPKNIEKLIEINEIKQGIQDNEVENEFLIEILAQKRETFSGVFQEPFDQSIKVLKKAESENLQEEVVEIFKRFIQDKRKYFDYLGSFSTITTKEKWKITVVYLALLLILIAITYSGFVVIGDEIKDMKL